MVYTKKWHTDHEYESEIETDSMYDSCHICGGTPYDHIYVKDNQWGPIKHDVRKSKEEYDREH